MARTREMTARTNASFSIEAELLMDFDAILARERKERSEAIREMVRKFVERKKKNPNPQATLEVRPFPNPWTEDGWGDLSDMPDGMIGEMLELGGPKIRALKEEQERRRLKAGGVEVYHERRRR